jgi:hypothetical protein
LTTPATSPRNCSGVDDAVFAAGHQISHQRGALLVTQPLADRLGRGEPDVVRIF